MLRQGEEIKFSLPDMARREKVQAIILARKSVGEADRLVTMFTREQGLMRVLAKGVRKIPSRRGGHLEPLTEVVAIVNSGREWRYLAHVETFEPNIALHKDEQAFDYARHLAALVIHMFEEGEAVAELYGALREALIMLPKLKFAKQVMLEASTTLTILRLAGFMPDFSSCRKCGERNPDQAVILDSSEGGWHCLLCHQGFAGTKTSLSPRMLKVIRFTAARPREVLRLRVDDDEARQMLIAMRNYVALAVGEPQLAYVGV